MIIRMRVLAGNPFTTLFEGLERGVITLREDFTTVIYSIPTLTYHSDSDPLDTR